MTTEEEWLLRFVFDCESMRERDMLIAEMRGAGKTREEIAGCLEVTPFRVDSALGRVDSGRYGED